MCEQPDESERYVQHGRITNTGATAVEKVRSGYGARADEYTEYLGSVEAMAAEDRRVIADWAASIRRRALDAGSGPGHWTAFLR